MFRSALCYLALFYLASRCFASLCSVPLCFAFVSIRVASLRFVSLRFTVTSLCFAWICFALLCYALRCFICKSWRGLGERWRAFAIAGKCLRVLMSVMRSARSASLARGARTSCEGHLRASRERSGSASLRFGLLRFALLRFVLLGFAWPSLCFA